MYNPHLFIKGIKERNKTLFDAETIKITSKSFEEQLKFAYTKGYDDAEEHYESIKNMKNIGKDKSNPMDIFGDIFGGKK